MAEETRLQSQATGEVFTGLRPPTAASQLADPVRKTGDPDKKGGPFVKYVGDASHRQILAHHWRATKGVGQDGTKPGQGAHNWDKTNNKMIRASEFSEEQLDYLLCDDMQQKGGHSFVLVDFDENGELQQVQRT